MNTQLLAERIAATVRRYEEMFAGRGGVTPSDPLQFHLFHLARYWSRLVGYCTQDPSSCAAFIDSELGACVQVGSDFAHKLIGTDSPIFELWQEYWAHTQSVLHTRPVTWEAVDRTSGILETCLAELGYDPWA